MIFHNYIIRLLSSYLSSSLVSYWLYPFLALAFLSVVPGILRSFFSWR